MKPKDTFDRSIQRSTHFLSIYDLLRNKRRREVSAAWKKKFKQFMNWPLKNQIIRIDGADSFLIIRDKPGLTRDRFEHDYVSEALRAAVVAAISALDRYFHDVVVEKSWKLLSRSPSSVPKKLANLSIPALVTKQALAKMRKDRKSRPGLLVKQAIQNTLHRSTFQNSFEIDDCIGMLGVSPFWSSVAARMPGRPRVQDVKNRLNEIAERRNRIVHEADLVRKIKGKKDTLRDITRTEAARMVTWVTDFIEAADSVVS